MTTGNASTGGAVAAPARSRKLGFLPMLLICAAIGVGLVVFMDSFGNDYAYLAAYTILQFIVLGSAFNILGGYGGYVNFGSAGFFATGVYTSVVLYQLGNPPLIVNIACAGIVAGILGFGTGWLTLRLRGIFFAIATLALAIVLNTLVNNWDYVGGARGVYILRPQSIAIIGSYTRYLFIVMLVMAIAAVLISRAIEHSWLGRGLEAIKDDETAAECCGVPALRVKLITTTLTGAMMGMAGAPFPFFVTYVEPMSAFNLTIAVNTLAMPLIGGLGTWLGPVVGGVLLGAVQEYARVTISSAANLLIVGVLLVVFITAAPQGIMGLVKRMRERG
jgi:branched-chain amino acid transport system permease protein